MPGLERLPAAATRVTPSGSRSHALQRASRCRQTLSVRHSRTARCVCCRRSAPRKAPLGEHRWEDGAPLGARHPRRTGGVPRWERASSKGKWGGAPLAARHPGGWCPAYAVPFDSAPRHPRPLACGALLLFLQHAHPLDCNLPALTCAIVRTQGNLQARVPAGAAGTDGPGCPKVPYSRPTKSPSLQHGAAVTLASVSTVI